MTIVGLLPPVYDNGDLLVDGGYMYVCVCVCLCTSSLPFVLA